VSSNKRARDTDKEGTEHTEKLLLKAYEAKLKKAEMLMTEEREEHI